MLLPFVPLGAIPALPEIATLELAQIAQAQEREPQNWLATNPTNSNNCQSREIPMSELNLTVQRLSNQAFQLAQEAAQQSGDPAELKAQAQALNSQLDQLLPQIQSAPADQQPELNHAWSDARLDVGYVLSNGELSPSTRLFYFLQNLK